MQSCSFRLCCLDLRGKSQLCILQPTELLWAGWELWSMGGILTLGSNSSCPWQNCSLFVEHNVWLKHSLFCSLPAICEPDSGSQTHYPDADRKGSGNRFMHSLPRSSHRYVCTFVCCSVVCKSFLMVDAVFVQSPRAASSQSSLPGRLDQ